MSCCFIRCFKNSYIWNAAVKVSTTFFHNYLKSRFQIWSIEIKFSNSFAAVPVDLIYYVAPWMILTSNDTRLLSHSLSPTTDLYISKPHSCIVYLKSEKSEAWSIFFRLINGTWPMCYSWAHGLLSTLNEVVLHFVFFVLLSK